MLYAIIKKRKRIKKKNLNRGFDLGSYWRRRRDSNPRELLTQTVFKTASL